MIKEYKCPGCGKDFEVIHFGVEEDPTSDTPNNDEVEHKYAPRWHDITCPYCEFHFRRGELILVL